MRRRPRISIPQLEAALSSRQRGGGGVGIRLPALDPTARRRFRSRAPRTNQNRHTPSTLNQSLQGRCWGQQRPLAAGAKGAAHRRVSGAGTSDRWAQIRPSAQLSSAGGVGGGVFCRLQRDSAQSPFMAGPSRGQLGPVGAKIKAQPASSRRDVSAEACLWRRRTRLPSGEPSSALRPQQTGIWT